MKIPDFIRDPETGRLMKAEDFIRRERKEWGDAFSIFGKELLGFGKQQGKATIEVTEDELKILLRAKKRR